MGSGGSNRIRTALVQVICNVVDHGMALSQAVHAPRIHFERDLLSLEPGFGEAVEKSLKNEFPQIHLWEAKNLFFGGVHSVEKHPKKGFSGVGDSRRDGYCLLI